MVRISAVPESHAIFNEFDEFGILLGLSRIELERNTTYKQRLLDVMVHRANSTYRGMLYGITRELGLQLHRALHIQMHLNADGTPVLPSPAVVIEDPYILLYDDYSNGTILLAMDRFSPHGGYFTLGEVADAINATGYFTATIDHELSRSTRALTLFNQTSAGIITSEDLAKGSHRVQLAQTNLVSSSVVVRGENLTHRVYTENEVRQPGDFYINTAGGVLIAAAVPAPGSAIRYEYLDYDIYFENSPIVLHDLNSSTFKTKLFTANSAGDLGLPTAYGADIINELLSVYPGLWGK